MDKTTTSSLIAQAQDIVAAYNPHPYYLSAYRQAETGYWEHIPAWLRRPRVKRIIDIGAAYGTLAVQARLLYPRAEVVVADNTDVWISRELLEAARLDFQLLDIETDELPGTFGLVIFTEVLEHLQVENALPALERIYRALAPEGALLMSTPDANSQWGRNCPAGSGHVYQYVLEEVMSLLHAVGFRDIAYKSSIAEYGEHLNLKAVKGAE